MGCLEFRPLAVGFVAIAGLLATACLPKSNGAMVKSATSSAIGSGEGCGSSEHPVMQGYGDADKLTLAFCDSFPSGTLESRNWVTNFGWGNITKPTGNEDHEVSFDYDAYFDASLVKVEGDQLHLSAANHSHPDTKHGAKYSSGAVSGHFQFMYGYIEARIRAPDTHGMWPAFWITFPFNWPPEIDIMELRTNMKSAGVYNYAVNVNYIYGPSWDHKSSDYLELTRPQMQSAGLCDQAETGCGKKFSEFQTYGVAWQPGNLDYFYNGVKVFSTTIKDEPRYRMGALLLNLAVGGWAEQPDALTDWSKARLDVDWVRIWSFPGSPTVLQFADGAASGTLAAAPVGVGPVAPPPVLPAAPAVASPGPNGGPVCPPGNDGSGTQWCDCYQANTCFPWCVAVNSPLWGYEKGRSCRAKPKN